MPGPKATEVLREVAAAGIVACVSLPLCVGFGYVAFAPLGPSMASSGALAGLTGGILAGAITALLGGTVCQVSAPTLAGALLLADLFTGLVADPRLGPSAPDRVPLAIALGALTVAGAGLLQVGLGLVRAGRALKYVAYPVLAGLSASVAILTIRSQLPAFLAASSWGELRALAASPAASAGAASIGAGVTGLITLAALLVPIGPLRRLPPALTAIVLGTLASQTIALGLGPRFAAPTIGAVPTQLVRAVSAAALASLDGKGTLVLRLLGAAASIAVLSSLNTLLASVAVDGLSGERHDGDRELLGQGVGNLLAGLLGGLSVGGLASLSLLNHRSGGRTRLAGLAHSLWLLLFVSVLGSAVSLLPKACLAGVVVVACWRLFDPRILGLVRSVVRPRGSDERGPAALELALVLGVAAVALWAGLVAAIVAGVAASVAIFVVDASRVRLHLVFRGSEVRSKVARPLDQMELLAREGVAIVGIELDGSVFFGSAERFVEVIERTSAGAPYVLLGLRRVDRIDVTGLRVLRQFRAAAARRGRAVVFAGLPSDPGARRLLEVGTGGVDATGPASFRDMDAALEWAESTLLAGQSPPAGGPRARPEDRELPLGAIRVLRGLAEDDLAWLTPRLARQTHAKGTAIVREGDRDRTLFLIALGLVEVVAGGQRLASFGAGTMVGEIALLDGGERSASVVTVEDTVTYALDWATLSATRRERPALLSALLLNLSLELSHRLRAASREIRALQA